jgi:hypothetical protein
MTAATVTTRHPLLSRETAIWLALMLLTCISWWLIEGDGDDFIHHLPATWITSAIFIMAFIKVRLVILDFMEIRHAPIGLRLLLEAWVVGVCCAVLFMYMSGN